MATHRSTNTEKVLLQSEAGFGLLEIILALAMIVALASTTIFYSDAIKKLTRPAGADRFNCAAHTSSFLRKLLAIAGPVQIARFFPTASPLAAIPPTGSSERFQHTDLIPDMWPSGMPGAMTFTGGVLRASNGVLIDGPMRILNVVYNSSGQNCSTYQTAAPWDTVAQSTAQQLDRSATLHGAAVAPQTAIRIQLYNLQNGQTVTSAGTCPKGVWIYPKGVATGTGDDLVDGFAAGVFQKETTGGIQYRNDRGFVVELQTTYQDISNPAVPVAATCQLTQKFSYDRNQTAPEHPQVIIQLDNPVDGANAHRGTATLTINSSDTIGRNNRGVVLACRDASMLTRDTNPYRCYSRLTPGPGPQFNQTTTGHRRTAPFPSTVNDADVFAGNADFQASDIYRPTSWTSGWVPCEEVTVCGRSPTSANVVAYDNGPPASDAISITSSYTNLHSECVARIEVAAMDVSGNLHRPNLTGAATTFNPAQITQAASWTPDTDSATTRPRCGRWCPRNSYWPAGLAGYFISAGAGVPMASNPACCTGAGCTAPNTYYPGYSLSTDPALPP